jgi:hypothetical protein
MLATCSANLIVLIAPITTHVVKTRRYETCSFLHPPALLLSNSWRGQLAAVHKMSLLFYRVATFERPRPVARDPEAVLSSQRRSDGFPYQNSVNKCFPGTVFRIRIAFHTRSFKRISFYATWSSVRGMVKCPNCPYRMSSNHLWTSVPLPPALRRIV